jgi:hypothetical protein
MIEKIKGMYGTYQMGRDRHSILGGAWPRVVQRYRRHVASMTDLILCDLNSLAISYIREV